MKLLTKEIEKKLPAISDTVITHNIEDRRFVCKFFDPIGSWTWYVLEGEKQKDGDWLFYGLVDGIEKEWGYFRLSELEGIATKSRTHRATGLGIERDLYFTNTSVKAHS